MKLEINNEKVNRLLHRTELECSMTFVAATPTREELTKEIASKKHVNESLVVIDSIRQEYGKKAASCFVKIYESEKSLKLVESKKPVQKKVKEKPAETAPEAPKEEEKTEEQAEEKKE